MLNYEGIDTNAMNPIIIWGTGRSGTTIFHRMLSEHPQIAWMSKLCDIYPQKPFLNKALMKLLEHRILENFLRKKIQPVECYAFWEHYSKGFSRPFRDLLASDVTIKVKRDLHNIIHKLTTSKRNRLLLKITGWPRFGFFSEVFGDAKFIHVMRDGRAVANSLINVKFWHGWRGPEQWRWGPLPSDYQREWEYYNRSFIVLAGIQWKILMDAYEEAKKLLGESQVLELKYEDLCSNPIPLFKKVVSFCGLEWDNYFEHRIMRYQLKNTNYKYRQELTLSQQEELESVLRKHLRLYGYF